MELGTKMLADLLMQTLQQPREAAGRLLSLRLSAAVLWQAFALVIILSVILTQASLLFAPAEEAALVAQMLGNPLQTGLVQAFVLAVIVFAIHLVGRAMGGQGSLTGAIMVVTWLELVMLCLQGVQTVAAIVLPFLAPVIGLFGVVLFFWLLTQFTLVLHGFRSAMKVFLMVLVTLFALAFLVAILFAFVGIELQQGVPPNV